MMQSIAFTVVTSIGAVDVHDAFTGIRTDIASRFRQCHDLSSSMMHYSDLP